MTLKHTRIRRKGQSRPVSEFERATNTVDMHTGYTGSPDRQLWLAFTTGASGVGYTDYRVLIGTDDFAAIINAMCDVDEGTALSAMADELSARLKPRP